MLLKDFMEFFKGNNLVSSVIATVVALNVHDISQSFSNDIVIPLLDRDLNNDGEPDIDIIKNMVIKITGVDLKVGQFLIKIMRMIIVIFVISILFKLYEKSV